MFSGTELLTRMCPRLNVARWRLQTCRMVEFWYMLKTERDTHYSADSASMLKYSAPCAVTRKESQLLLGSSIISCLCFLILLFFFLLCIHVCATGQPHFLNFPAERVFFLLSLPTQLFEINILPEGCMFFPSIIPLNFDHLIQNIYIHQK